MNKLKKKLIAGKNFEFVVFGHKVKVIFFDEIKENTAWMESLTDGKKWWGEMHLSRPPKDCNMPKDGQEMRQLTTFMHELTHFLLCAMGYQRMLGIGPREHEIIAVMVEEMTREVFEIEGRLR